MKIKVHFNQSSIKNAIKTLKEQGKKLKLMQKEFFQECCIWFIDRANANLNSYDIGDIPKAEIQNSWSYVATENGASIKNTAEKAVFVEFGVGVIGGENEHPNAEKIGYKYNVDSEYKLADGSWMFKTYEDELDIPQKSVISQQIMSDDRIKILTAGTQGAMYAHNALIELKAYYPKIWEKIKIKYWS